MIKIITALGNPILNNELKKEKEFVVPNTDVQYQEAVLEILEKDSTVEILILSEVLPGEKEIKEFIEIILKINSCIKIMIIIQEEKKDLINFLNNKNIHWIFINNKITTEEIILLLKKDKEKIINKNKIESTKEIKQQKEKIKNKKIKNRVIRINLIGSAGVGKTVICSLLALYLSKEKGKKVLMLNSCENNSKEFHVLFGKKEHSECIKINSKLFLWNKKIQKEKLQKIEEEYEIIIYNNTKYFNDKKEKIILLIEPNLLEIHKANELIKKLRYQRFHIIINKKTEQSIDTDILKRVFSEHKIIGEINYHSFFQKIINTNMNLKIKNKKLEKELEKISKELFI